MLRLKSFSVWAYGVCFVLAAVPVMRADDQFDLITVQLNTSSQTVWRISHPNVRQAVTSYPSIKFLPGDSVSIDAGGCVQTGGHGKTWKRYVNPSGDNSDHLYHGKVSIPGVTNGLVRIQGSPVFNHAMTIPAPGNIPANQMVLQLGYEDDGYGDNGYWGHDDGTEDQCKNSQDAFVIVSVGHNGTLAANPADFTGIQAAQFRCQAAWAFHNYDTSRLSQSSFDDAFSLHWWDYVEDPTTEITYLAARGIASGGDCFGMSLLADVGEDQFITGNLSESFWANYKTQNMLSPSVSYDINVAHWKQLSTTFIRGYLATSFNSPTAVAQLIAADLNRRPNYNYGVISIESGGEGHALTPIRVTQQGNKYLIDVYDSNRPCPQIPDNATYPQIVITGNSWSYVMADGKTWSGSQDAVGFSSLGYVGYTGQDGWSDLGANLSGFVKVIFGANAQIEQVASGSGKRLYVQNTHNRDTSAQSLGKGFVRIPKLAQQAVPNQYGRPRTNQGVFPLHHDPQLTAAQKAQVAATVAEYEPEYGDSGQIYLASPAQVDSLTFTLSAKAAGKPVRMMVSTGGEFYEINSVVPAGTAHPKITLHSLKDMTQGVSVSSLDATGLKVTLTHGVMPANHSALVTERTAEMAVTPQAMRFTLSPQKKLQLVGPAGSATVQVLERRIDATAKPVSVPLHAVPIVAK
jgi:hypothetical protein